MINATDDSAISLNPLYLVKKTLVKEGKLHKAQLEMAKKPQIL